MKIKKLDTKGFSHEVLALVAVAIFIVAGVGYLVTSHAASRPVARASSSRCVQQYFFVGSRSTCVYDLIIAVDYAPGRNYHVPVPRRSNTNYYGPGLSRAVSFVQSHIMHVRSNGKVSPTTWSTMCSILWNDGAYPAGRVIQDGPASQMAQNAYYDAGCV